MPVLTFCPIYSLLRTGQIACKNYLSNANEIRMGFAVHSCCTSNSSKCADSGFNDEIENYLDISLQRNYTAKRLWIGIIPVKSAIISN